MSTMPPNAVRIISESYSERMMHGLVADEEIK